MLGSELSGKTTGHTGACRLASQAAFLDRNMLVPTGSRVWLLTGRRQVVLGIFLCL